VLILLIGGIVFAVKKCGGDSDERYGSGYYGSEMSVPATATTPTPGKLEVEWIDEDSDEELI